MINAYNIGEAWRAAGKFCLSDFENCALGIRSSHGKLQLFAIANADMALYAIQHVQYAQCAGSTRFLDVTKPMLKRKFDQATIYIDRVRLGNTTCSIVDV